VVWRFIFDSDSAPTQLLGDYWLGLLIFLNFVGARYSGISFSTGMQDKIKYLASHSFSFYLFHIPVFSIIRIFFKDSSLFVNYLLVLSGTAIVIMWLAKFTEHKKGAYRALFRRMIGYPKRFADGGNAADSLCERPHMPRHLPTKKS
jgi:peptidoglycan/LPS O-acetylase OafA/YrhL